MHLELDDKVIIITGAASGIGRAIAEAAAAEEVEGLVLVDIDGRGLSELEAALASKTRLAVLKGDLTDVKLPARVVETAIDAFGRVDGLVNSAALTLRGSFVDGTPALWEQLFALNARAPFFLMQATIADMRARRAAGAIVNILSVNAHCGTPELAIYAATKGALQTLTKNAAHAHAADLVRVNGINLGWTLTPSEHRMQSEILGHGTDWAEKAGTGLPLGRLLLPDEAAQLALYLLSPASAPMTGTAMDLEQYVLDAPA